MYKKKAKKIYYTICLCIARDFFLKKKKNKKGETQTTSLDPTLMAHRNTICARSVRSPSRALATNTASLITFASNTCASPKSADGILSRGRCDETTTTLTTNQKKSKHVFTLLLFCLRAKERRRTTANSKQRNACVALVGVCGVRVCRLRSQASRVARHQEGAVRITNSLLLNLSTRTTLEEAARLCDATSVCGMIVTVIVFLSVIKGCACASILFVFVRAMQCS